jgi:urease accessory protein
MIELASADVAEASAPAHWRAALKLRYERDAARTVLAERSHIGPLVVQKSLYPEGDAVCQNIIVHPPAGIVGGDTLRIDVALGAGSLAQLTTPGAAKWYRSAGAAARSEVALRAQAGATLEWLPQEAIVFDGAIAQLSTTIELSGDAVYLGWDLVCLGRAAAGEQFARGSVRQRLVLRRDGVPAFIERAALVGGSALMDSPVGLKGCAIFGTFLAAAVSVPAPVVTACRAVAPDVGEGAVTSMRGCLIARYRGTSAEAGRAYFAELWHRVRPALAGRDAVAPRIWNT